MRGLFLTWHLVYVWDGKLGRVHIGQKATDSLVQKKWDPRFLENSRKGLKVQEGCTLVFHLDVGASVQDGNPRSDDKRREGQCGL